MFVKTKKKKVNLDVIEAEGKSTQEVSQAKVTAEIFELYGRKTVEAARRTGKNAFSKGHIKDLKNGFTHCVKLEFWLAK